MISRVAFIVLTSGLATGCLGHGARIGQPTATSGTREPVLSAEDTRKVMTKQAPDALIAPDGSSCRVAPDVFASTKVGSFFRCRWVLS
jgi:hypothetical protein